ncbi:MAG: sensor histidine kinase [Clostridiales bacterium]|mgnify:CR=1 FL=1|nr:sensor histidine kinase [Clostridiales bacterium]
MLELSLNILDIAQNSIAAGANLIKISIEEDKLRQSMQVKVEDNGRGMPRQTAENATDPFFTSRTTRKVGLGIPLFKMAAEMTGGSFKLESQEGKGTKITALFKTDSLDFVPLGDMGSSLSLLISMNPNINFEYCHKVGKKTFELKSKDISNILGDLPLNLPEVTDWISQYVAQEIAIIHGGVEYEDN